MTIPKLNVLLVEDQDSNIGDWQDAAAAHNADIEKNGYSIETVFSKTVSGAKSALDLHRFDAVIVDLRLQVEEGVTENNSQGNDLVRHVLQTQPLGVVVYTGQQGDADIGSYACPQVQVMDKGDGLEQVFSWLSANKDVFLTLRGAKTAFNRETAKVFFKQIWPRWTHWSSNSPAGSNLTETVARHVTAHVHDSMLNAEGEATHPEESYFVPPIKSRLDTGDLVDYQGKVWVVVTPRCDLANQGKVATILLAQCTDISLQWNELQKTNNDKSKEKSKKLIQHESSAKQHFLFGMRDIASNSRGPWMAQFHHLLALPATQAIEELTPIRFASLSPLFVPSLVERFGAYFSRIGTPGFSSD